MKHRLISLIWVQLNMNFAISHSRYYYLEKRQRLWEGVLIVVSVIMTAAVLAFGVYKLAVRFLLPSVSPTSRSAYFDYRNSGCSIPHVDSRYRLGHSSLLFLR